MGLILGRAQTKIPKDIRSLLINRSIVVHTVTNCRPKSVMVCKSSLLCLVQRQKKKNKNKKSKLQTATNSREQQGNKRSWTICHFYLTPIAACPRNQTTKRNALAETGKFCVGRFLVHKLCSRLVLKTSNFPRNQAPNTRDKNSIGHPRGADPTPKMRQGNCTQTQQSFAMCLPSAWYSGDKWFKDLMDTSRQVPAGRPSEEGKLQCNADGPEPRVKGVRQAAGPDDGRNDPHCLPCFPQKVRTMRAANWSLVLDIAKELAREVKWYDMIWFDLICYVVIWYDTVRYDMIWHDRIG